MWWPFRKKPKPTPIESNILVDPKMVPELQHRWNTWEEMLEALKVSRSRTWCPKCRGGIYSKYCPKCVEWHEVGLSCLHCDAPHIDCPECGGDGHGEVKEVTQAIRKAESR